MRRYMRSVEDLYICGRLPFHVHLPLFSQDSLLLDIVTICNYLQKYVQMKFGERYYMQGLQLSMI